MDDSPWEACCRSANQESFHRLWHPKFYYHARKTPAGFGAVTDKYSASYISKNLFNIILLI